MARANRNRTDKVDGEYTTGEGWEAGNVAPSDKYLTVDGKVVDELPKGEGGWQLAIKGSPVTPALAKQIEDADAGRAVGVPGNLANENSPGDHSNREDGAGTAAASPSDADAPGVDETAGTTAPQSPSEQDETAGADEPQPSEKS